VRGLRKFGFPPTHPPIAGGHAKANPASGAVLEKLGFVYDRDDMTPHVDGVRVFDSREYYLDLED
jgi:ribosomal-protein-alanine N-acetyltransferase